jgi:23S rRNA (adenine2030-N6)-methyltransferase
MNYRHAFHAGNFADVFKHTLLIGLLEALRAKPAAFCYVDTHAGRGLYDLRGEQAVRTREAADGVQRLLAAGELPAALRDYLDRIRAINPEGEIAHYPGSPLLARALLREQDRAILCELQEDEAVAMRTALHGDARCAIHHRDGYAALKALLPPPQKRGLVLIDPPFEAQAGEYAAIEKALEAAFRRWPNAIYAVWYPIKRREAIAPFHRWLRGVHAEVLVAELLIRPDHSPLRLNGCGAAIVNPPWQFDRAVEAWLPTAQRLLAADPGAGSRVEWLRRG